MLDFTVKVLIDATKSITDKNKNVVTKSLKVSRSHRYNLSSQEILLILIVPQKFHLSTF